ncbi:MAG: hypothetical protein D6687_06155 [Acidobacteria bacterium]|jgi:3-polyprenyl-4-hydroxybenzoate decarboxylase|nr:MAG: hypothetical protein D6687_06155 [Acidobacteriota bacterium]GIU82619.1 MAG: hypothetical protein KatS3mg006_1683 [Pyrinomonadaceae bacterium]
MRLRLDYAKRMKRKPWLLMIFVLSLSIFAQKRDHLTEKEIDLIRFNQELDKRIEIYVQAIERRMLILEGKILSQKDVEKFGTPTGGNLELLSDISKILFEAIQKIEDVAERDAKNKLIPKSVKALATACKGFMPRLENYQKRFPDRKEQGAVLSSIEYCQQVIDALEKVP